MDEATARKWKDEILEKTGKSVCVNYKLDDNRNITGTTLILFSRGEPKIEIRTEEDAETFIEAMQLKKAAVNN